MSRRTRTKDVDCLALVATCKAIERSSSVRMIAANLRFMWDRYLVHPPANAWWAKINATNPGKK